MASGGIDGAELRVGAGAPTPWWLRPVTEA